MTDTRKSPEAGHKKPKDAEKPAQQTKNEPPQEVGGRGGLDPVRYGDWEVGGKCVDF